MDRFTQKQARDRLAKQGATTEEQPPDDTPVEQARTARVVGRNDMCPCGSGKKHKKCCGKPA